MALAVFAAPRLALRIAPLTVGHAAVDFTQGALPALLPYMDRRFGLSYTQDGLLFLALTVSSSVTQPIFGHFADRGARRGLLPFAVAVSGIGLASATLSPGFPLALAAIFIAGLGVAAYHPEASRLASALSGVQRGTGMSIFSVGGNVGFASGAALAGLVAASFGLGAGWLLGLPALAGVLLLLWRAAALRAHVADAPVASLADRGPDDRRALGVLLGGLCLRGYVNFGMLAFVPLYEERVRHHSARYGDLLLSLLLFGGAILTLFSGPLADRIGPRRTMVTLALPVGPLIAVYLLVPGVPGAAAIVLGGGLVIGTFSISIVLSQLYLPSRVAMAAGLSIGFSIGIGGAFTVVIGRIADSLGLTSAMSTVAAIALVSALMLFLLPPDRSDVPAPLPVASVP